MADDPNPQRLSYGGRVLPKVFIAFPHKPTVYQQRAPPEGAAEDPELKRRYDDEVVAHELAAEEETRGHEKAVKRFAEFLQTQSLAVAYDLQLRDQGTANIMRWCQTQIADSDYLIIIVTPSLLRFLDGQCPSDMEPLFSSDYLYNTIHSSPQKKDGKTLQIVPVFLDRCKNYEMVPVALRGGSVYEVCDGDSGYREPLSEGMISLLCRLTGQNRYQAPPPGKKIVIEPQRSRFGPKSSSRSAQAMPQPSAPPPPNLLHNDQPLGKKTLTTLSEKSGFSQQWKKLAPHLGLSESDVERCQARGAGDEGEACLQMLMMSAQRCSGGSLTPAMLTDAIEKCNCPFLYDILQSVM